MSHSTNHSIKKNTSSAIIKNYQIYILLLPALIYFGIFHYGPMYGLQIAFKDFIASEGITGSPWVGFEHFKQFFNSYYFGNILRNTLWISIYSLVVGFPIPIIFALLLNEMRSQKFKKAVQMVTYAPHFISTVVMVGMIIMFLSPGSGIINKLLGLFGIKEVFFMSKPDIFPSIYVFSGVWQNFGWNAIVYLAALAAIDVEQYEAAIIDGASRLQRIIHINIPGIAPMVVIMLLLSVGNLMNVGFEKVFLMQNPLNMETSDIISTYVYKRGLIDAQYSFSSAVGLFNSVVNLVLLVTVNWCTKKLGGEGIW